MLSQFFKTCKYSVIFKVYICLPSTEAIHYHSGLSSDNSIYRCYNNLENMQIIHKLFGLILPIYKLWYILPQHLPKLSSIIICRGSMRTAVFTYAETIFEKHANNCDKSMENTLFKVLSSYIT